MAYSSWSCAGAVQKEDGNLFVRLLPDVYAAVNSVEWLVPSDLSRLNFESSAVRTVAELDAKSIATQDNRSVTGLRMSIPVFETGT